MTGWPELILKRRSVRSFDGKPLREEDAQAILSFAEHIQNPYDLPITWKLLDAKRYGLSSMVITGTNTWIAGKINRTEHAEEAFGYAFEKTVLFALSRGVGTTWIAGTMNRKAFETAMDLKDGEVLPCVSPLGYPAEKMSLREKMMRSGVKADVKLPFEKLFFEGSFDCPITEEQAGDWKLPLQLVRMGPSAVNYQPWRIVRAGDTAHFYRQARKGIASDGWDLQKIDVGIAMCHFEIGAKECGYSVNLSTTDPGIAVTDGLSYVASLRMCQHLQHAKTGEADG